MKILAIETSTKYLSVAFAKNENILASFRDRGELKHSSLLIPAIRDVLKESGFLLRDIDAIALSIGPGSFTGLRIGVAAVKAINLALNIPVIAIPTLDVIAYNFTGGKEEMLCPVIDAKKKKVYASFYKNRFPGLSGIEGVKKNSLKRLSDYILTDTEHLIGMINKRTLLFGDAVKIYESELKKNPLVDVSHKEWFPSAEAVAILGTGKAVKKEFCNPDKLIPMYLHSQYCQVQGYKG